MDQAALLEVDAAAAAAVSVPLTEAELADDSIEAEEANELGAIAVDSGTLTLEAGVDKAPVMLLPMIGGELLIVELGVAEVDGLSELDEPEGDLEEDAEPPLIEVMAKAGLALPESPITSHADELLVLFVR